MIQSARSELTSEYTHTQKGPWPWVLGIVSVVMLVAGAAGLSQALPVGILLIVVSVIIALLGCCVGTLTVSDGGDELLVRYGPLPAFRFRIPYDSIRELRIAQSRLIDGWGIHYIPGRGWTCNLYGYDCIEFYSGKRLTRIGTDDPNGLYQFLQNRIDPAA